METFWNIIYAIIGYTFGIGFIIFAVVIFILLIINPKVESGPDNLPDCFK
jgi:hypothetical protein